MGLRKSKAIWLKPAAIPRYLHRQGVMHVFLDDVPCQRPAWRATACARLPALDARRSPPAFAPPLFLWLSSKFVDRLFVSLVLNILGSLGSSLALRGPHPVSIPVVRRPCMGHLLRRNDCTVPCYLQPPL
jgi:hypothetical protein